MMPHGFPTADGVLDALTHIDPVFLRTPVHRPVDLSRRWGLELILKDETANPIRSFKGRGACHLLAGMDDSQHVVCASAGNFGQGIAWAARRRGLRATVFVAKGAVASKVSAIRKLGAEVVHEGLDFDAAKVAAREYATAAGACFVEDGAERRVAEGAGTIAMELTETCPPLDAIVVPLGNGALAGGIGCWMRHASPGTRVVAVGAEGAPAMVESVRSGAVVETEAVDTVADGIAVRVPIPYAVEVVSEMVDAVALASDAAMLAAAATIRSELGLTVEPAGAAGLAFLLSNRADWVGRRVAVPLCGGNV